MTDIIPIDFRNYVQSVAVLARHALPLSQALADVMPLDADTSERAALDHVTAIAHRVQGVKTERERTSPPAVKDARFAFISAWSALYEGLGAVARVPVVRSARGPRAAEIVASLFPYGVGFTTDDAAGAWAEGRRKLDRIEAESLRATILELVVPELLANVEQATSELGAALGLGRRRTGTPPSNALQEARRDLSHAVAKYCRVLAAKVDEDDPVSIERFRSAVTPVDQYRITRGSTELEDDEGAQPIVSEPVTEPAPIIE